MEALGICRSSAVFIASPTGRSALEAYPSIRMFGSDVRWLANTTIAARYAAQEGGNGFGSGWLSKEVNPSSEPMQIRKDVVLDAVLWVFALFLSWIFIRQGFAKFDDASGWARAFRTWHFPVWFRVLIGVLEVSAAMLLLWKRTAFAGAVIIMTIMLGAMGTHIYWSRPSQVTSEILPLFLSAMVALGRRRSFVLGQMGTAHAAT